MGFHSSVRPLPSFLLGFALAASVAGCASPAASDDADPGSVSDVNYDVVAYGGSPASVMATIQAARMGKRALLVSPDGFVGGLTSGGLTATDTGNPEGIGGLAQTFYQRLGAIRDFSPRQAEAEFRDMLQEEGVAVLLREPLISAELEGEAIRSITLRSGDEVRGSMFVDGTYEGDLLATANVSYHVGREPSATYGETLGGQWQTVSWEGVYQFCGLPVDPYVVPGDPSSGLLPEISAEPAGRPGDGDHRVQAYNFRMCLTDGDDRIPFPKPSGYDPGRYALLARFLEESWGVSWTLNYTTRPMTDGPVQMRNGDSNNAGSFSSDYVGGSHRWPDGTYEPGSFSVAPEPRRGLRMPMSELHELRERLFEDHLSYGQGLMYFLANDEAVPAALRDRVDLFGLDPDEFAGSEHWPHALYVREGRRMDSDYVMTQANCESRVVAKDSVGVASYAMDSHFCQRVVVMEEGRAVVRNEGGFGHGCPQPYPIAYASIVPRRSECVNLLVPICLSASHVAYGSIRMEPVFMILGQSAGTAASLCIDAGVAVQDLRYEALEERLVADGQVL